MALNKTTCWMCEKEFEYEDPKYRDVDCTHCGTMNSIYDPADYKPITEPPTTTEEEWLNQEEEMGVNYNDEKYQGKYVYLPLMKETATFEIVEMHETKSENPKVNFSENVPVMANGEQVVDDDGEPVFKKKDLGYHVEATLKNGKILSITSMSAFIQVFKKNNIQDGDTIKVCHKDKGVWEVEKL